MKKRHFFVSIMTLVLCLTIISGATFALFTSESKVDITVKSGKVSVESVIENLKLYSMDEEQTDFFENGGSAVYEDGVLTLDKMTPGDKVEFDIKITNSSNIDIKYKLRWSVDGKLGEALVAKADGEELENLPWTLWEANAAEKEFVIKMVIELPVEAGNEYQEKSCDIKLTVAAIQANGLLVNYVTPETINEALANAKEGDEIELSAGYYDEIVVPKNGMKFFTQEGAQVGFIDVNAKSNVTIQDLAFDASGAKAVYDMHKGGTLRTYANIAGAASKTNKNGAQNLIIDGCTFTGKFEIAGSAIAFADRSRTTSFSGNVTIKDCKFETENGNYDIYGYYTGNPNQTFIIENNEFASKCYGQAVYIGRLKTNETIEVKGNTFKYADTIENAAYIQGDTSYAPVLDAANNTFGSLVNYVNPKTIGSTLANAQEGYVIELAAGYYEEIVVPKNGMKFFTVEGAEVGFLNVNGKENVTIQGLTFDAAGAKEVKDSYKNGTLRAYANIAGASDAATNTGAVNLVIDGCTFNGEFVVAGSAIAFADRSRTTGNSGNVTIKNCKFETTNANYDVYGYYTGNPNQGFTFENNEFASECRGDHIYLGRLKTSGVITVKGNSFSNAATIDDALYIQGDTNYAPTLDAANNTFN